MTLLLSTLEHCLAFIQTVNDRRAERLGVNAIRWICI